MIDSSCGKNGLCICHMAFLSGIGTHIVMEKEEIEVIANSLLGVFLGDQDVEIARRVRS